MSSKFRHMRCRALFLNINHLLLLVLFDSVSVHGQSTVEDYTNGYLVPTKEFGGATYEFQAIIKQIEVLTKQVTLNSERLKVLEEGIHGLVSAQELMSDQTGSILQQLEDLIIWRRSERLNRSVVYTFVKRLDESSFFASNASFSNFAVGITKHDDRIYVVYFGPTTIRVFEDWSPFNLLSEIQLTEAGPSDIVYNDRSKSFYVIRTSCNCIMKITIINDGQTEVTTWLNRTNEPHTMSLSSDGHLLVLRDGHYSDSNNSQLDIYSVLDARLKRSIQLHSDIKEPQHAIEAQTGGQFLISHRVKHRDSGQWVISRVTSDGRTIIAQSKPRNKSEELDDPRYLSLDSENDRVFVADYFNDRVVVLDSFSLDFRQILQTREGLEFQQPHRLYYDKKKKQLLVGQFANVESNDKGVVDVFVVN